MKIEAEQILEKQSERGKLIVRDNIYGLQFTNEIILWHANIIELGINSMNEIEH